MKDFFTKNKYGRVILDLAYSVIGSAMIGASLAVFTIPNNIAPGGVSGLATALAEITPLRVSVWTLLLNVPLLLFAWKFLGPRSLLLTLISTVLLSVFIELGTVYLPRYTKNELIASFCGGALSGLGVGILFLRGISTGGTDLLVLLIKKLFPNVPNGTLLLFADITVVAVAVLVFRDVDVAMYSAIAIMVTSRVIDALAEGVDYAKVIYTITEKGNEVAGALMALTDRGTTILPAIGGYTGAEKQMIIMVTRRNVLAQTLGIIKQADPQAFTFVMDSTEVHGEGFKGDE